VAADALIGAGAILALLDRTDRWHRAKQHVLHTVLAENEM